jgi:hypothetical protein
VSSPDVFEIFRPYSFSNSGAGSDDPEYAAMQEGDQLGLVMYQRDKAMLLEYDSVRYPGTRRFGVVVYMGMEHTVHSFSRLEDGRRAFAAAERRVGHLPGGS